MVKLNFLNFQTFRFVFIINKVSSIFFFSFLEPNQFVKQ